MARSVLANKQPNWFVPACTRIRERSGSRRGATSQKRFGEFLLALVIAKFLPFSHPINHNDAVFTTFNEKFLKRLKENNFLSPSG